MPRRERDGLPGPGLCGFWGVFEGDRGDPRTPEPLDTVIPSRVGGSLLPFRCPGCGGIPQDLACPDSRKRYLDDRPGRGNHWCPLCGRRFFVDLEGVALPDALPARADVAPSLVREAGGAGRWQDRVGLVLGAARGVLGVFGALSPTWARTGPRRGLGYGVLAASRRGGA